MTRVSLEVSDEELLDLVRSWVDLLAAGDYESAISRFGYSLSEQPDRECILSHLRSYRSDELYPGVTDFAVTDWRTAVGGNQDREQIIEWYDQSSPIAGAISYDLPLNGRWSDLTADFVLYARQDDGYILCLEEIRPYLVDDAKG